MAEMKQIPIKEFDWAGNGLKHQHLTCKHHPTARYLTKNPTMRLLHIVQFPDGMAGECPCPYADLVVLVDTGEEV